MVITRALGFALAALALLAGVAPSDAQIQLPPTGDDQIGIYAEPDFDGPNAVFIEGVVGDQLTAYIVLTGLTAGSVGGFECEIDFAGDSEVIATTFPVEALDIEPEPDQITVAFATPVPADDGIAMVCTLDVVLLSDPEWLFLGPPIPGDLPTEMTYVAGDGITIFTLYPSSGAIAQPVFAVNTEDVVTTETTTWSSLKTHFK